MSNGYGDKRVSLAADMAAYDQAPPLLRWAVAYAVSPFSVPHLLRHLNGGAPLRAVIEGMRETDAEQTHRTYGPAHPEADPRFRGLAPGKNAVWTRGRP